MDKKISIFEDVSKEIINKFFKKEHFKRDHFSFYFDEDKNHIKLKYTPNKYFNFDDIPPEIFIKIKNMMIKPYDFSIEIIKKYCLIVKNIESFDIDILSLLFKSIDLQLDIIKHKNNNSVYENIEELENFVIDNLYFNIQDYIDLLNKYYSNRNHKPLLINIFVMVYNYSLFYSIEKLKKIIIIKN